MARGGADGILHKIDGVSVESVQQAIADEAAEPWPAKPEESTSGEEPEEVRLLSWLVWSLRLLIWFGFPLSGVIKLILLFLVGTVVLSWLGSRHYGYGTVLFGRVITMF